MRGAWRRRRIDSQSARMIVAGEPNRKAVHSRLRS